MNIHSKSVDRKYIQYLFYALLAFVSYLLLKDGVGDGFFRRLFAQFQFDMLDKWVHIAIFSALSFLMTLGFPNTQRNMIFLVFYGVLIEILQGTLTVTRSFDLFDIVADIIGIAVGYYGSKIKIVNKILKLSN